MSEYKTVEEDDLKSLHPNLTPEELEQVIAEKYAKYSIIFCMFMLIVVSIFCVYYKGDSHHSSQEIVIRIISMDFVAEFDDKNNTTTQQQCHYRPDDLVSARWDLLIRVPGEAVGDIMCLQGNLQASFLYKNVTLVTSSMQSYNKLETGKPQLLKVSAIATKEDLKGSIGNEIMDAIKERNEVRFGSRLFLTDCREETKKGTMGFECQEAKLRFEPGSDQIKATKFGNHRTCFYFI